MKKLLLILICLFVSFEVKSKETDFGELVKREGVYYKKFSETPFSGKVFESYRFSIKKGKLKKGIKVGEWSLYSNSGQLIQKMNYKNGKLNGENYRYGELQIKDSKLLEGFMYEKSFYKEDKLEGIFLQCSLYGILSEKSFYKNGKLDGEFLRYHHSKCRNPNKEEKKKFKNKKKTEIYKYCDGSSVLTERILKDYVHNKSSKGSMCPDIGFLEEKSFFKNGNYHGEYIKYHNNGQINIKGQFINDKPVGEFFFYSRSGKNRIKTTYNKMGEKHGEALRYHWENNIVYHKENYKNGLKDGEQLFYNNDGQVSNKKIYKDGKLLSEIEY